MLFIEELNLYANAKFAKWLATVLVIFFICYHGFLHIIDGGDSCQRLLSDGRFQGSLVWQPYGCMVHTYSKVDTRRCLRYVAFLKENNHIVFMGDSRIRDMYYAFINKVRVDNDSNSPKMHSDLYFDDSSLFLHVKFYWRPFMGESGFKFFKDLNMKETSNSLPKLIVLGSGSHTIKTFNGSIQGYNEYLRNLTSLASVLNRIGNRTRVLWMLQDPVIPNQLSPSRKFITNDQIDLYNKAAIEILSGTTVHLWSSSRLIAQGSLRSYTDGLHAGPLTIDNDMQVLLNLYCNNHLNYNDGTCCNSREEFTLTQILVFAVLSICSIVMIVVALKQWLCSPKSMNRTASRKHLANGTYFLANLPAENDLSMNLHPNLSNQHNLVKDYDGSSLHEFLMAIGKLGLIVGYFFLCDRTSLFMKENKYFTQLNFWLPIGYVFALGLFFTEDSAHTHFLHRDMSNEWKGWMQLVILIYHMTGASQFLPIYLYKRILISSNLFLLGYSHFTSYWSGCEMGIVRYLQVMFRLNFLTVVLCLVMNQPYQFYYFIPLASYWYSIFYVAMVLPPHISRPAHSNSEHPSVNYLYCLIKFVVMGSVITVFYLSEVFFERVFVMRPWKALFVTADDDIHEWWNRWKLDRYSLLYGAVFGMIYQAMNQHGLINDKSGTNLLGGRLAFLVSILAAIFASSYAILTPLCHTKDNCDEIHPYMVWVPILGYLTLRNVIGLCRTRYSTFFSWFGAIYLEIFVCQYHIWLAADTHGVLVLIPSYPVANVLVTSFIFMCACHELHRIINVITRFVAPSNVHVTIRNVSFIVLAVFGLHLTMTRLNSSL